MMLLAAALVLPSLLTGGAAPPADAIPLTAPRVNYRANEASATRSPWIDANGWRILRSPGRSFVYPVKGQAAALAAAEAFTYGARAFISADAPGAQAFGAMLGFLRTIPEVDLAPVADVAVNDDGSDASGELLNLLARMNLLYRIDRNSDLRASTAQSASITARSIRSQIGEDRRSLRIYGSEVVIGRLMDGPRQGRVFLLNYGTGPVLGLRVRVRGRYSKGEPRAFGIADARLTDWTDDGQAVEFTIPELHAFAVIDLLAEPRE
jgi:hypothetical protein